MDWYLTVAVAAGLSRNLVVRVHLAVVAALLRVRAGLGLRDKGIMAVLMDHPPIIPQAVVAGLALRVSVAPEPRVALGEMASQIHFQGLRSPMVVVAVVGKQPMALRRVLVGREAGALGPELLGQQTLAAAGAGISRAHLLEMVGPAS
jgi:hypothetical protein